MRGNMNVKFTYNSPILILLIKLCKQKSKQNFINNLSSATCFGFVSHLQAEYTIIMYSSCRSQWPRGLRRRSKTARLLRSWVRIPPGAWTFVCCECCVLLGRGLCEELITRPEESYRLWCVSLCVI